MVLSETAADTTEKFAFFNKCPYQRLALFFVLFSFATYFSI